MILKISNIRLSRYFYFVYKKKFVNCLILQRNLQPNSRSTMCLNMDGEQLAKPLKQTPTKKVVPRMKLTTPGGKMMSMKI